jgi:hypothetical protein
MTKQELILELQSNHLDDIVMFIELLDDGRTNHRTMYTARENIINMLNEYFDDDLHGHFKDEVYTTILYIKYITETVYKDEE